MQDSKTPDRIGEAMERLEEGIKRLTDSGEWRRFLQAQAMFHNYSYANTLLILAQRPEATRIAGMKTWNKLGRHVCKGEKALWILAPVFAKKADADAEKLQDKPDTEEERIVCFRPVPVFDVAQTDGADLPMPVQKLNGDASGDLFDRLAAFSAASGCPVTVEPIECGANGYYAPKDHRIVIREGLSPDQAAKTLAHEVTHSILHRDAEVYAAHRGDCELEAESTAFIILAHFGVDAGAYSFGYVSTWQGGSEDAIKALKASAARIQATARRIIDGITVEVQAEAVTA